MLKSLGKGSRQTKKKCVKSSAFSCKFTCLPRMQPSGKPTICRNPLRGQVATLAIWMANHQKKLLSRNKQKPDRRNVSAKNAIACALNFAECKIYREGVRGYEERTKDAANAYMDMFIAEELMPSMKKLASSMRNPIYYDLNEKEKLVTGYAIAAGLSKVAEKHPNGQKILGKIKEMDADIRDVLADDGRRTFIDAYELSQKYDSRREPMYNLFRNTSYNRIEQYLEANKESIYKQVLPDIIAAQNEFKRTFKDNGPAIKKINSLIAGVEKKIRQESKAERKKAAEKISQADRLIEQLEKRIDATKKRGLTEDDYDEIYSRLSDRLSKIEQQKEDWQSELENDYALSEARELRGLRQDDLMLDATTEERLENPFVDRDWDKSLQKLLKGRLEDSTIQSIIKVIKDDHAQYIED